MLWALYCWFCLSSSFLPLSLSCFCPDPAALSFWFAAAAETFRLAVRLWVVGCPPALLPPQSGWARWLVVRACGLDCTVNWLLRWLFAPGGLLLQLTYFPADYFCLSACCVSVPVCSVNWSVSLLRLSFCLLSELACQPVVSQFLFAQ